MTKNATAILYYGELLVLQVDRPFFLSFFFVRLVRFGESWFVSDLSISASGVFLLYFLLQSIRKSPSIRKKDRPCLFN